MPAEERKKLVEEKNIHLWFAGSPVALCSVKLELDMNKGSMFAYAKLMNVQPENISTVVCDVICYDSIRNVVDVLKGVAFYDLDIPRNGVFGMDTPVRVRNNNTRNIEYVILSVTTTSGDTWKNEERKRFDLDLQQKSLINVQADYNKDFINSCTRAKIDHTKLILAPVFDDIHWMCACGTLNWNDENTCSGCGVGKDWLIKNTDLDYLKSQAAFRLEEAKRVREEAEQKERLEKERQKEEFAARKESYRKQQKKMESKANIKKIVPVVLILALLVAGGAAFYFFGMPYIEYQSALSDINNGKYDEAIEKLFKMKNYNDSEVLLKKAYYGKGSNELYNGDPIKAMSFFDMTGGYSDSMEKYYEAAFAAAKAPLLEENYMEAADYYRIAMESTDDELRESAEDFYNKCRQQIYRSAQDDMASTNYRGAYKKFLYLEDYKSDCKEKADECVYLMGKAAYRKRNYSEAIQIFESIRGYKDVDEILEELDNLKKVTSAASDDGMPAVWNGYEITNSKTGEKVDYVLEFYLDGRFKFAMIGSGEENNSEIEGSYKIEGNIIYRIYIVEGSEKWRKYLTIESISSGTDGVEGKNTTMKLEDPFGSDEIVTVYGNIISDDTISI